MGRSFSFSFSRASKAWRARDSKPHLGHKELNNAELYICAGFHAGRRHLFIPFPQPTILWVSGKILWRGRRRKDDQEFKDVGIFFIDYLGHLDTGVGV